jgi:hypothetical protein
LRVSALSEAIVQADAVDLATGWDRLTEPEKRHLVETITDKIIVGKEEVAVNLLYFPGEVIKQRGHAAAATFPNRHRPAAGHRNAAPIIRRGSRDRCSTASISMSK